MSDLLRAFAPLRETIAVAILLLSAAGCSEKPTLPETYPVRGKVVFQGGGPVPGGTVTFQPQSDTTVSTEGVIGSDGTFAMYTYNARVRASGAIAGPHRVLVTPPLDERQRPMFLPVAFPKLYTVKPGDNEVTLTVPNGEIISTP